MLGKHSAMELYTQNNLRIILIIQIAVSKISWHTEMCF